MGLDSLSVEASNLSQTPSIGEHMKNKSFDNAISARDYYNEVTHNYVAFFIYNYEEEEYEVINQDLYDHYTEEYDLHMRVIDFAC